MSLIILFIILQTILLPIMALHDWIHLPPLTNIRELEKHSTVKGRFINSTIFFFLIFIPLLLTIVYQPDYSFFVRISIFNFYFFLSVGTIFSWWVPYFFGSSEQHKKDFEEYKKTHHFLPARGDNVIPNTFHVLLHLLIWSCCLIAGKILIFG